MEAKSSQEDILRSYRDVIEGANSIILRWDKQGTILYMNPFGLQLFGFTEEELFGKNVMGTIVSASSIDGKDLDAMIKAILDSPDRFAKNENENICKDGRRVWINWTNKPVLDESGEYVQIISIGNDVTERRMMEKKLVESEEKFRLFMEYCPVYVFFKDEKIRAIQLSRNYEKMLGRPLDVLIGKTMDELFPSDLAKSMDKDDRRILREGKPFEIEEEFNGRIYSTQKFPIFIEGKPRFLAGFTMDITDRKRAEVALRESESRYRSLVESTNDWVWATDRNGLYTYASPKVKDLIGYEPHEIIGRNTLDFMRQDQEERLLRLFRDITNLQKPFAGIEKISVHKDGRFITLESSGVPVFDEDGNFDGYRGIDRDITERKQMERLLNEYRDHLEELVAQRTKELAAVNEQLQQSQKMEAVGLLAGGIAHEFNNILTTIKGSMHLIQKKQQTKSPVTKYTEQIMTSINKASSLSQDLLAFSRKQTITLRPMDFNWIIQKATSLLSRLIGEHIELTMNLTEKTPTVMTDINQMEQVLVNLVNNARDAMPDGGKLTIRTEMKEMDEGFLREHGFGAVGNYVLLTVSDTGVGMGEEIKGKIYEPFFTTKALGKGSGLGLAVTYGIVKQHNGFIDVETALGKGTTFRIYLPAVEAKAVQPESRDIPPATGGREMILLAEDDADTRET